MKTPMTLADWREPIFPRYKINWFSESASAIAANHCAMLLHSNLLLARVLPYWCCRLCLDTARSIVVLLHINDDEQYAHKTVQNWELTFIGERMINVRVFHLCANVVCPKNSTVEDYGWQRSYYFPSSYSTSLLVCNILFGTPINVAIKVKLPQTAVLYCRPVWFVACIALHRLFPTAAPPKWGCIAEMLTNGLTFNPFP